MAILHAMMSPLQKGSRSAPSCLMLDIYAAAEQHLAMLSESGSVDAMLATCPIHTCVAAHACCVLFMATGTTFKPLF